MALRTIATGGIFDLDNLGGYEEHFGEGEQGVLDFELRFSPPSDIVQALEATIRQSGVMLTRSLQVTSSSSPHLKIHFEKRLAPLAILAIIVGAAFAFVLLVIGWKLLKVEPSTIAGMAWGTIILIIVGVIVAVIVIALAGKMVLGKGGVQVGK